MDTERSCGVERAILRTGRAWANDDARKIGLRSLSAWEGARGFSLWMLALLALTVVFESENGVLSTFDVAFVPFGALISFVVARSFMRLRVRWRYTVPLPAELSQMDTERSCGVERVVLRTDRAWANDDARKIALRSLSAWEGARGFSLWMLALLALTVVFESENGVLSTFDAAFIPFGALISFVVARSFMRLRVRWRYTVARPADAQCDVNS